MKNVPDRPSIVRIVGLIGTPSQKASRNATIEHSRCDIGLIVEEILFSEECLDSIQQYRAICDVGIIIQV
jgi:hypothetical protein